MPTTRLTAETRQQALEQMEREELDVLVVGGGVTGAGIALDAATRGLNVGIIEAQDWSSGTSSRSSKLVHGGLRYLYNLDVKLVAEALHERGLLLSTIAPHLVRPQAFLWPLKTPVLERGYSAVGIGLYDALAFLGSRGHKTLPFQKHLSKRATLKAFPDVNAESVVGSIRFFDSRVDDSRLVITLVRTAARYGALAASRTEVTDLTRDARGRVTGAIATDLETGTEHSIRARETILATGVWTEETQRLSGGSGGLRVLASKGVHIVVPRDRIAGTTGLFLRTEKSVLFIIPWPDYWIIGTTDTAWHEDLQHPTATRADIDYILDHANAALTSNLTRDDIIGVYAGLRPLLQPGTLDESKSTKVSREHTVTRPAEGLTSIAGGKLTTYRVMAQDAVDFVLGEKAHSLPSVTERTPLVGADGYTATRARTQHIAAHYGWDAHRVTHLLHRYGSAIDELTALVDDDPSLGLPLAAAPRYLRAEVVYAVTHEGALHLEDILLHRIRLHFEQSDHGVSALDEIGTLVADLLGLDTAALDQEKENYRQAMAAQDAAEQVDTDEQASAVRNDAPDLLPLEPLAH